VWIARPIAIPRARATAIHTIATIRIHIMSASYGGGR
jgi:hypothetical protein